MIVSVLTQNKPRYKGDFETIGNSFAGEITKITKRGKSVDVECHGEFYIIDPDKPAFGYLLSDKQDENTKKHKDAHILTCDFTISMSDEEYDKINKQVQPEKEKP